MKISQAQKRLLLIIGGLVVVIALWSQFRPELLLVNHQVDEPFPTTQSTAK